MSVSTRRLVLAAGGMGAMSLALGACSRRTAASPLEPASRHAGDAQRREEHAEVSAGEDLMREHGVLARLLLIYESSAAMLEAGDVSRVAVVRSAADTVRRFVEDYHERLEEKFLFPRFEAKHELGELVSVLRRQHQRGRALTDEVRALARPEIDRDSAVRLAKPLRDYIRMYRPHAAREDTVLFPAFLELVGDVEYGRLGEEFEEREHAALGDDGFGAIVRQVSELERQLGIDDLARFTPA